MERISDGRLNQLLGYHPAGDDLYAVMLDLREARTAQKKAETALANLRAINRDLGSDFNAASDAWKSERKQMEKHIQECIETNNAYLERCRKAETALAEQDAKIAELQVKLDDKGIMFEACCQQVRVLQIELARLESQCNAHKGASLENINRLSEANAKLARLERIEAAAIKVKEEYAKYADVGMTNMAGLLGALNIPKES